MKYPTARSAKTTIGSINVPGIDNDLKDSRQLSSNSKFSRANGERTTKPGLVLFGIKIALIKSVNLVAIANIRSDTFSSLPPTTFKVLLRGTLFDKDIPFYE